ncbi:MAG: InlB B-repeat-containing protein [Lachnospiraceae bacterium]|nr:InlB B-repeat-containing protein [Lachnospiraceae bacterium]
MSKYAEGGSAYYEPTNGNEGYYFAGWYADPDCQIPFDFNTTMPDSDITVYAKWDTYRVRVVLVPTPNNEHNDEVQLANNQALSFRLDYNEQVDDSNINTSVAKRPGYKLIGWYYSPGFDPTTEIHFPVLINNNTPGVDMNYQLGEDWNKYGDNDGSHDNVRGILKLYAKWELDVDENSVYVEYDVDDVYRTYDTAGMLQTTIPVDDNKYALTNNNVTFQVAEAPTEYTSGFEFYRWVLLNPDGSESDIMYNPADTASEIPSSFIYEETITDDLGNTATIKKIRLKAKFNIETEKVTTVTFDGNGGVTNDSAQQESVTESYPINKDFLMKDENSFVREGYTLLGWAFEREDGSKITVETYKNAIATMTADDLIQAGIYQLGQKVAADNLEVSDENNWNPLENTVYAVWEINKYTVTVKKVVEGDSEGKTFTFTATASGDYTLPETDAGFALPHDGTKTIENVPYGSVLTFKETPASGYSIKSVDAKQTSLPDKTPLEESAYIELDGDDGEPLAIKGDTVITYTNEKVKEQKLRIHKIGDDAEDGLAGATFSLTSSDADGFTDMTELVSMDGTASVNPGYLPSGDVSDTTLFTLPSGNYTLMETEAPQYYEGISGDIALSVMGDGIRITSYGADEEAPFDEVSISEPDVDGVYTLTVTNTKKKGTVTVVKNVIGNDADKDTEYRFTAKGLTQEDDAFVLHGRQLPENPAEGEAVTQENKKVYEDIPYGTVFSITEETYGDFDTTIEISNEAESITDTRTATGNVTVDGDITISYTNKRNKQPVAIYKTGLGEFETITTGASFVVYKASEFDDDTQSAIDEAVVVAQGTTNENGILILGKLPIESGEEFTEYRLVETTAPAGYDLPDYLMKIFVYPDKVFGMQATGNMLIKDAEDYSDITDKSTTVLRVWNNPGVVLPSTGGPGTNLIYLLGIILTAFAGAGLVMRKRQRDAV